MSLPVGVTVLGSTGSVGVSTLDVLGRHPDRYRVFALTANRNHARLFEQCLAFEPEYAVMVDAASAETLRAALRAAGSETEVLSGAAALATVAAHADSDYVMAAIVGAAGLLPTLAAAEAGKRVMLANKEALVMSGQIFMDAVARSGAELLPIDSEHNAIFQCMPPDFGRGLETVGVRRILLTASGGPFRTTPLEALASVTPAQAVAHPNWDMGRKISVDSATMMNKGLEVIEACWLFATDVEHVQVVLHPQSVVHSMVQYQDGSTLAQLGNPDMRTPIAHCLAWPNRIEGGVEDLDVLAMAHLDFEAPDLARFPCLRLAYEARRAGGIMSTALNAANEVAVEAFLDQGMDFLGIPAVIEAILGETINAPADDLDAILTADAEARERATRQVAIRMGG